MRVRIQKLAEVQGGFPAADKNEYVYGGGGMPDKSIPLDYWLEGELVNPITVGESVVVLRDTRNGVKCPGVFQTSPVTEVTEGGFATKNSVYLYKVLTSGDKSVSLAV